MNPLLANASQILEQALIESAKKAMDEKKAEVEPIKSTEPPQELPDLRGFIQQHVGQIQIF